MIETEVNVCDNIHIYNYFDFNYTTIVRCRIIGINRSLRLISRYTNQFFNQFIFLFIC